jgi:hypothetical protein
VYRPYSFLPGSTSVEPIKSDAELTSDPAVPELVEGLFLWCRECA